MQRSNGSSLFCYFHDKLAPGSARLESHKRLIRILEIVDLLNDSLHLLLLHPLRKLRIALRIGFARHKLQLPLPSTKPAWCQEDLENVCDSLDRGATCDRDESALGLEVMVCFKVDACIVEHVVDDEIELRSFALERLDYRLSPVIDDLVCAEALAELDIRS